MDELKSLQDQMRDAAKECWKKRNKATALKQWDMAAQYYGMSIGYETGADMIRAYSERLAFDALIGVAK